MPITHAQPTATNFVNGASTTLTAILTNAPAVGDLVCVGLTWFNGTATPPASVSIADGNGNTYTKSSNSPSGVNAASNGFVYAFYLLTAPANAHKNIIATYTDPGASGVVALFVDDFTVVGGTVAFDNNIVGNGSGPTINTPTITPSAANDLLFCFASPGHAVTSVNSPWTQGAIATGMATGYILSASGATALNMTVNTTGTWDAVGLAFRFTPTAAGCTGHIQGAGTLGTAGANTVATTLPAFPTQGNLVLVGIEFFAGTNPATITSLKDENNNSYTVTPNSPSPLNGAASGQCFQAYLLKAPANAGKTITVVFSINSTSSGPAIWVDEFSYAGTASFDADYPGTGTGTALNTPASVGNFSNELLYGTTSFEHVVNAVNSPWILAAGGFLTGEASGYIMSSAAPGVAFNMSGNTSGNWSILAQAIKFTAASGGLLSSEDELWAYLVRAGRNEADLTSKLRQWLIAQTGASPALATTDLWMKYFTSVGVAPGSIDDRFNAWRKSTLPSAITEADFWHNH